MQRTKKDEEGEEAENTRRSLVATTRTNPTRGCELPNRRHPGGACLGRVPTPVRERP